MNMYENIRLFHINLTNGQKNPRDTYYNNHTFILSMVYFFNGISYLYRSFNKNYL